MRNLQCSATSSGAGCREQSAPLSFAEGVLSYQAVRAVLAHSKSHLSSRLVLLCIAEHANEFGTSSYPSLKTICREANLDRRGVCRAIADLERLGEILVIRTVRLCNRYTLGESFLHAIGESCPKPRGKFPPESSFNHQKPKRSVPHFVSVGQLNPERSVFCNLCEIRFSPTDFVKHECRQAVRM